MSLKGYAYKTVNCHIAAITYINKLNNFVDNTQCFIVRSLLEGMNKSQCRKDTRLPITSELLNKIVGSLKFVCSSLYESKLFTAAFMLAFYALLRVSEITLHESDVCLTNSQLCINIRHSKTDQLNRGFLIKIPLDINLSGYLRESLMMYKAVRPVSGIQYFCHIDGSPLTPLQFRAILAKSLKFLTVDNDKIKSHSFRIGGATYWYMKGLSSEEIKNLGRWSSNSYKLYVRPSFI